MKKLFLFVLLLLSSWIKAEITNDSIVMTIGDKKVSLDEFLFMARKNNEVDFSSKKSLKNYVFLFRNFKLKVIEAEELGMDTTDIFKKDFEKYRSQLILSYLSDIKSRDSVLRSEYKRADHVLDLEHIVFRLPRKSFSKDTLSVYKKALSVYQNLLEQKKDFAEVGKNLMANSNGKVVYEQLFSLSPLRAFKAFEDKAFELPVGQISHPVRSSVGYHLIRVKEIKPNNYQLKVAHILLPDTANLVDSLVCHIAERARSGEDFSQLANIYSIDINSKKNGGVLPPFGKGEMIPEFENAAFALKAVGDISDPVKSRYGFHVIKLIEKKERPPFELIRESLGRKILRSEWMFECNRSCDEKLKKEYDFIFYPEVYKELQLLSEQYYPLDSIFMIKSGKIDKKLFEVSGKSFYPKDFVLYMNEHPFSVKSYAGDFMREIFDIFVHDLLIKQEKENLEVKHPEFKLLLNEYREGSLLFNISSNKVWSYPVEKRKALEELWINELNKKYPVTINWSLINKLKN